MCSLRSLQEVMAEFCDPDEFQIILGAGDKTSVYTLREILPMGFTNDSLKSS